MRQVHTRRAMTQHLSGVQASSPHRAAACEVAGGAGPWLLGEISLWTQPVVSPLFLSLSCPPPWFVYDAGARPKEDGPSLGVQEGDSGRGFAITPMLQQPEAHWGPRRSPQARPGGLEAEGVCRKLPIVFIAERCGPGTRKADGP